MKPGKLLRSAFALGALALASLSGAAPARAAIVERVVAVVGERPILLSELRHRARPFQYRILATTPGAAQQAAQETEMFRELLNRMIDDRLEEQAADKAHLAVSPDDVDSALRNVANGARISVRDLLNEAKKQGLTEQDYRDEIRRQVLEGKLVQLRVRGRVRVTDEDAKAEYTRWLSEVTKQQQVDPQILALRILPGSTPQQIDARVTLAQSFADDARRGKDWCELIKTYSEDTSTKDACGSRGPQPINALVPELQQAWEATKPGDYSAPIKVADQAVLVLRRPAQEVKLPRFEEVKDAMAERAFGEAMERQRKQWLQELRRGVYIDVRL